MSNNYNVKQTPLSEEDLDNILAYIALDNMDAALMMLEKFSKSFEKLSEYPFSGSPIDDKNLRIKGYKKMIVEPSYIIIYFPNVETNNVNILRIFNMNMDYVDEL